MISAMKKLCKDCECFRKGPWVDHSHCVDKIYYSPRDVLPKDGNIKGCRNWRIGTDMGQH